jgi:hypothetical protein
MAGGRRVRQALLVAGVAVWGATGCLPAGGPPAGERWVSGRALGLLQFAPGANEALLVTGPVTSPAPELYLVADPGPSVPSSAAPPLVESGKLLLSGFSRYGGAVCVANDCRLSQDSAGHLLAEQVSSAVENGPTPRELFRLDPTAGTAQDLGPESSFTTSASGDRVVVVNGPAGSSTVYEAGGRQTALPNVEYATFVGEDLYGLEVDDPAQFQIATLENVPPNGAPQAIAYPVSGFQVVAATDDPFIILSSTDGAGNYSTSLLDPATLTQTSLPGSYQGSSSDGRWLQLWTPSAQTELFDRTTGTVRPIDVPPYSWVAWRPRHDECWVASASASGSPVVDIFEAGGGESTAEVVAAPLQYTWVGNNNGGSSFTPDGRHWFSGLFDEANRSRVFVGPADDPTAPTFPVNPPGTGSGQYWLLADGRLLVEAYVTEPARNDIYLVDPDDGQSRALATGGFVVAIGPTRALALLDWIASAGTGDLALIDFATGAMTRLAENVAAAVLQKPYDPSDPSADALAPGAAVAFQVRDLLDSPYDGIWVATLP